MAPDPSNPLRAGRFSSGIFGRKPCRTKISLSWEQPKGAALKARELCGMCEPLVLNARGFREQDYKRVDAQCGPKRQPYEREKCQHNRQDPSPGPVSYTHLDVYKRQAHAHCINSRNQRKN